MSFTTRFSMALKRYHATKEIVFHLMNKMNIHPNGDDIAEKLGVKDATNEDAITSWLQHNHADFIRDFDTTQFIPLMDALRADTDDGGGVYYDLI